VRAGGAVSHLSRNRVWRDARFPRQDFASTADAGDELEAVGCNRNRRRSSRLRRTETSRRRSRGSHKPRAPLQLDLDSAQCPELDRGSQSRCTPEPWPETSSEFEKNRTCSLHQRNLNWARWNRKPSSSFDFGVPVGLNSGGRSDVTTTLALAARFGLLHGRSHWRQPRRRGK